MPFQEPLVKTFRVVSGFKNNTCSTQGTLKAVKISEQEFLHFATNWDVEEFISQSYQHSA